MPKSCEGGGTISVSAPATGHKVGSTLTRTMRGRRWNMAWAPHGRKSKPKKAPLLPLGLLGVGLYSAKPHPRATLPLVPLQISLAPLDRLGLTPLDMFHIITLLSFITPHSPKLTNKSQGATNHGFQALRLMQISHCYLVLPPRRGLPLRRL